jgi:excisionase family DNA binding protein
MHFTITLTMDAPEGETLLSRLRSELAQAFRAALDQAPSAGLPSVQPRVELPKQLLWTIKEVAKALGISDRTVWGMAKEGRMPPPIRFGTSVRWNPEVLRGWIAKGCPPEGKQKTDHPL